MRSHIPFLAAALILTSAAAHAAPASAPDRIDRHAVVSRHNITVHAADPNGVLAVGNGNLRRQLRHHRHAVLPRLLRQDHARRHPQHLGLALLPQPRRLLHRQPTFAPTAPHTFLLTGRGPTLNLSASFSPAATQPAPDAPSAVEAASTAGWLHYWTTGGIIDLSGNSDPRAAELERRIVLSQYLMAVHDAGDYPPQETGLAVNSWYGKFHMEMYWWHSAHWALWGHPELLERSLSHLHELMAPGEAMARLEGARGVKWSKMTDPTGNESPSGVGPALVWQQPHPIYLAELDYRARLARDPKEAAAVLRRYQNIVFATADYIATFVDWDPARKQYVLGPGLNSADEKHLDYAHNLNPTMEIAYWHWALDTARQWRTRLNLPPDPIWDKVSASLAPPVTHNGIYSAFELPAETSPSTMATFMEGVFPGRGLDQDAMRSTLRRVAHPDAPQTAVTWGTGMVAMCAARLGQPELAVSILVGPGYDNPATNPFRASGYSVRRPEQTPVYMPANGAWLSAVALMAAGWDGNTTTPNPGFPPTWHIRSEGLLPLP